MHWCRRAPDWDGDAICTNKSDQQASEPYFQPSERVEPLAVNRGSGRRFVGTQRAMLTWTGELTPHPGTGTGGRRSGRWVSGSALPV